MDREVRFCTTEDGVRIAYCVEGAGPDFVCCPDFVGSFSLDHLIADQMPFWRGMWQGRRVIRFDMRGTGLSQRDVESVTHEAVCRDLDAVVKASHARRFTLYASTLSGPRAIAYAVRHPRQVRRLILHRTFADAREVMEEEQANNLAGLSRLNWPMAAQMMADLPVRREIPDAGIGQAQQYIESASGEIVARILTDGFRTTDVSSLLPQVRVPTLILHRTGDPMFTFAMAQRLAAGIPHARLVPLSMGIMSYIKEGAIDAVLDIINDFVDDGASSRSEREEPPRETEASIQTVLWTDLVDHSEMMQMLGDTQGRAVLREHERITRAVLKEHGGAEIKTMGDGFMAAFRSVTSALDAAIALQRAFAERNEELSASGSAGTLHVRVGLNAGEPIAEEGDLFGASVIMASRIAAQAGSGEILLPEPVRHLLAGKTYVYVDRGDYPLKGFDEPVRLFEVRWRD